MDTMNAVYRTNWIAKTRRRAVPTIAIYFVMLIPAVTSWPSDRAGWPIRAVLALLPLLLARLCWNFLAEAETRHETPTPEMEFVFRLMTLILIVGGGIIGVALVSL